MSVATPRSNSTVLVLLGQKVVWSSLEVRTDPSANNKRYKLAEGHLGPDRPCVYGVLYCVVFRAGYIIPAVVKAK